VLFLSDRSLDRINRAVASGRILPYLALFTLAVTFAAALVMRVFAHGQFDTLGESLWWAAQTVTTVGYGDVVMLFGIAAVSLMTAVVTSAVVTWSQRRFAATHDHRDEHLAALERIERRLDEFEKRLP
jgi:voltage-gated potassium channel